MKQEFFTSAEYAQIAGCNERSARRLADRLNWHGDNARARMRKDGTSGRPQKEYHYSLFDSDIQARIFVAHGSPANQNTDAKSKKRNDLWSAYEAASSGHKETAQSRLDILQEINELIKATKLGETAAMQVVAEKHSVAPASIWNWKAQIKGVDRPDWLAALLPQYVATAKRADIHPDAWDFFVSDYLRPEKPAITACYRRLIRQAETEGWSPIPHERSLRRRLKAEVSRAVQVFKREGRDKAKTLIPAQRRSVSELHAMEAVNMDGHKFDVFVNWPGHDKPVRPMLIALQDVYSRKFVAWRLDDSENKETVRLVIGDMVEKFGIPDKITMDNGRAFASKWISGGFGNRFRFKVNETDPKGLLVALGIDIKWAQPGHGQAKPIERAFGDVMCEDISRHPICSGAYTGNNPMAKPENYGSKAIDQDVFIALVDQEIAAHNARQGRRTEIAKGRSFDDAFNESYEQIIPSWPAPSQRALWLMAADKIRAQRGSGEIHFFGNRYWNEALSAHAGRQVIVRFDPDNLHQPLRVYDTKDGFICEAANTADVGFYSKRDAREHARDMSGFLKATKEQAKFIAKLDPATLGEMTKGGLLDGKPQPDKPKQKPKVQRLATPKRVRGNAMPKPEFEDAEEIDVEGAFARGLKVISGGKDDE